MKRPEESDDDIVIPHKHIRWTVERVLLVCTLAVSLLGFTFGLGVNWAEVQSAKAQTAALADAVHTEYVRTDVYTPDQRRLSEAIDRLTRALEARAR